MTNLILRVIFLCYLITISVTEAEDADDFLQEIFLKSVVEDEKKCLYTAGELVFILDASTSVGPDDFNKEKDFATKIIDRLAIGSNLTRAALITYNSFPTLVFNLHQHNTSKDVNLNIMKAEFTEGISVVGDALNIVLKDVEPKTRSKLGKVIILISDGKRNGGMDPFLVAKQLKSNNYTIITIGLDKDSDETIMKAISSNNLYYVIKNFDALERIVSNIVSISCITFHTAKCPKEEVKKDDCINEKQTVHVTAYYYQKGKCIPESRKLVLSCLKPNECPKQYYSVAACSKNATTTHLLNVTHSRFANLCAQNLVKLKEVACGCPKDIETKINVVIGKNCINGTKSEVIVYNEFRQLKCQQSFFTIAAVKCQTLCQGKQVVTEKCIGGNRTIKTFVKKFVNNKCELILESSSTTKCVTSCPKSTKIVSKHCVNKTRTVTLVSFQNVDNKECVQKTTKLDPIKCQEDECPSPRKRHTPCVLNRQIVMQITYARIGNKCKRISRNIGVIQCVTKKCQNSTYEVQPCDKNSKSSFLIQTYFQSSNGTCTKKTKKVKELPCKCYEARKRNISVTIGKKCEKGYRSRVLVLMEERQGKCVDVKFTLRRIKCRKRCFRRRYTVTKCKDKKREIVKTTGKLIKGKCQLKVEDRRVIPCMEECPKQRQRTTRCILGRQLLLEIKFKKVGEKCKGSVKRLKIMKCDNKIKCLNSTYEVTQCEKNSNKTSVIKTIYRNINGTCVKKILKIKEVPCKCYQTAKANIKVVIGKLCDKGFRTNELVLQEDRQGKCIDVKFTLRRIRCLERCLKREIRITKCKDGKRDITIYRQLLVNGMCNWNKGNKKTVTCTSPCPATKHKRTRCILGKRALLKITFKEEGLNCKTSVIRLKLMKCEKRKKCRNTTFEVQKCEKGANTTFLVATYYSSIKGSCIKKSKKVKQVSCKCYENRSRDVTVTTGKVCTKGYHTRELVLHEERLGKCVDVKFKLRRIRCIVRCLKREYRMTTCKDKKREISRYRETLVGGKCEWRFVDKRTVDCKNLCPKTKQKTSRCILGKQALMEMSFKEAAGRCLVRVTRLKMLTCNVTKVCDNSSYHVTKCEKSGDVTYLVRTSYVSLNGTCLKKTRKLKKLPCKCYLNIKGNLTITVGKTCEKGFRSRDLVLLEERSGKCVDFKVKLRRIRCQGECSGVRTIPGPCVNERRLVKSYENVRGNGTCAWKFVRESTVNCTNPCPQAKTSETPCLFGKKALIRTTYTLVGKSCIPKVENLKFFGCKNCTEKSLYKVENCKKGEKSSNLVRISFKDCKQKVEILKSLDCSCYSQNRNSLKVSTTSQCINGTRTRVLYYHDKGKTACEQMHLTIKNIKCGCYGNNMTITVCKNKNRTLTMYKKEMSNGKCKLTMMSSRSMQCKSVCPEKFVKKSKCIKNRTFETSHEYKQVGDFCVVVNNHIKWSNCTITTISSKECSKKVDLVMTSCDKGNSSIIARRQVKKDNKCMEESRRVAVVDCDGKCERTVRPKLVAGRCEKSLKLMFHVSTRSDKGKCFNKIVYLGKINCKDC